MIIMRKLGITSDRSLKSMFLICESISAPTMISTGAVANAGMIAARGVKINDNKKQTATVTAVRPVLPPA